MESVRKVPHLEALQTADDEQLMKDAGIEKEGMASIATSPMYNEAEEENISITMSRDLAKKLCNSLHLILNHEI